MQVIDVKQIKNIRSQNLGWKKGLLDFTLVSNII